MLQRFSSIARERWRTVPFGSVNWRQMSTLDLSQVTAAVSGKAPKRIRRDVLGDHGFDADLLVIGGGSGGLACAREASKLGASVVVLDAVSPSPMGTTWGLGGTCVNVGCIPKKLFHQAGLLGTSLKDAEEYGWKLHGDNDAQSSSQPRVWEHDWAKLRDAVQDYIHGTNWGYRSALRQESIEYVNAFGRFVDAHTVQCTDVKGSVQDISAQNVVIAVGGRPSGLPDIPHAESLCISSDDVFSLETPPGRTLVIGASYVALECAGFLTSLGYDTSVMMRSIPLRGFDQQMAGMVVDYMSRHGTRFLKGVVPVSIEATNETSPITGRPKIQVAWSGAGGGKEVVQRELFDTVMLATGRHAVTGSLNLDAVGVKVSATNGKVIGREPSGMYSETSSVDNIFALGDCLDGKPELTPVAIQAGRLLARRLYGKDIAAMDYVNVPTAVFTPMEYGSVGLSEEAAIAQHGEDNVEVYHLHYDTLEMAVAHRTSATGEAEKAACYVKAITVLPPKENRVPHRHMFERVVGLHLFGPNAGEVVQGFAVAMKLGLTMHTLTSTIGIHPTQAEEFVLLDRTKRSGVSAVKTSC